MQVLVMNQMYLMVSESYCVTISGLGEATF